MSKYRVTGRDATKATLIVESVSHPEEQEEEKPIRNLREILANRKREGGQDSVHRKFFLEHTATACRYAEAGAVVYFPTKKAAKRVRNVLNRKFGSSSYHIVSLELRREQQRKTFEEALLEEDFNPYQLDLTGYYND